MAFHDLPYAGLISAAAMRHLILLPDVTWIFSWPCICCRFPAVSMHGDKSQQERDHVLRGMQSCCIQSCWYWAYYCEVYMFFLGAIGTCKWSIYNVRVIDSGVLKCNHKLSTLKLWCHCSTLTHTQTHTEQMCCLVEKSVFWIQFPFSIYLCLSLSLCLSLEGGGGWIVFIHGPWILFLRMCIICFAPQWVPWAFASPTELTPLSNMKTTRILVPHSPPPFHTILKLVCRHESFCSILPHVKAKFDADMLLFWVVFWAPQNCNWNKTHNKMLLSTCAAALL